MYIIIIVKIAIITIAIIITMIILIVEGIIIFLFLKVPIVSFSCKDS
jgi:hypothetical protein